MLGVDLGTLALQVSAYLIPAFWGVVLAVLGWWGIGRVSTFLERWLPEDEVRRKDLLTLLHVGRATGRVLVLFLAGLIVLRAFGVDITPLLASAGILGLALGLGGQTLVQDLIGGLFILLENQFDVGDVIEVNGIAGAVERMTLRATYLRDLQGRLHLIPNGEIRTVTNMTREWSRAVVEVGVGYEADLDRTAQVLEEVCRGLYEDPEWQEKLLEAPQVVGVIALADSAVVFRIMAKTRPGQHWGVTRELLRRVKLALDEAGIPIPYPRREIWLHQG